MRETTTPLSSEETSWQSQKHQKQASASAQHEQHSTVAADHTTHDHANNVPAQARNVPGERTKMFEIHDLKGECDWDSAVAKIHLTTGNKEYKFSIQLDKNGNEYAYEGNYPHQVIHEFLELPKWKEFMKEVRKTIKDNPWIISKGVIQRIEG
jgi:hypothetical protein